MAIYVTALEKGGYSAYGGVRYDPHDRVVLMDVFEDEVIDAQFEFQSAPTEVDYEEDGIEISEPTISGNTLSFQFQELHPSGRLSILAMFSGGAAKRINFQANPAQPYDTSSIDPSDDDDVDYGAWG